MLRKQFRNLEVKDATRVLRLLQEALNSGSETEAATLLTGSAANTEEATGLMSLASLLREG